MEELNKNVFENYLSKNIFLDNGFTMFKPLQINCQTKAYVLTKTIPPPIETTATPFKKVVYVGYWINYDNFVSFIDDAHANGVTHIVLEFIVLTDDLSDTKLDDTILSWSQLDYNKHSDAKGQYQLLEKMKGYGITLMVAFGGATTFVDGFQTVLTSAYSNPSKLAEDLVRICTDNHIYAIDLDIEHFPYGNAYAESLVNYAGELSQYIKKFGGDSFIVSHAPQTPYFNVDSFGYVYSKIEKQYGSYIDFYNIQYYNQGDDSYKTYNSIFIEDINFKASIKQLIKAPDDNCTDIPPYKIVLGKATSKETDSGFVPLYSTDATVDTMTKYVNRAVPEIELGGIMVWLYRLKSSDDSDDPSNSTEVIFDNDNLMQYFGNVPN